MQNFVSSFFKLKSHLLVKRVVYLLNACIKIFGNRISALHPVGTHSAGADRQSYTQSQKSSEIENSQTYSFHFHCTT